MRFTSGRSHWFSVSAIQLVELFECVGQRDFAVQVLKAPQTICLDASGLETLPDAVGTERALVNFLRVRVNLGNIERAA